MLNRKLVLATAIVGGHKSWTVKMMPPSANIREAFSEVELIEVHAVAKMNYFVAHKKFKNCINSWSWGYPTEALEYTRRLLRVEHPIKT